MAGGATTRKRIIIVGAGFGGLGLGIRLKLSGVTDFAILEKSDSVGGVWAQNRYPGAACDVPAHLYSFSFEPRPDWPQKYASQTEILRYLRHCARKYEIEPHIRFATEMTEARWDETASHWMVRTGDNQLFEAQSLIIATGQLSRPVSPQLPGLASFTGSAFHSAAWRQDHDLRDRCVAVVGTGASAIQLVPAIAPLARKLYVFQRSAPYVLPKPDRAYPRWQMSLFKRLPGALRLSRLLTYVQHEQTAFAFVTWRAALRFKRRAFFRHLRRGVRNEELRQRLIPDYRMGCKRILLSNDFYPAMDRSNVELVTQGISEIRPHSIVTTDAAERNIDCIIFATGFAAADFLAPMKIIGRDGLDLRQSWKTSGAQAYFGMTIAGFPNLFLLNGPNTKVVHNSVVYMIESQLRYVMACLRRLGQGGIRALEVKRPVQERFNARLQRRLQNSIWTKGCTSWYLNAAGKIASNWPSYSLLFRLKTREPNWNDYTVQ